MKKILPLLLMCCACSGSVYDSLNLQASKEYLEPIRTDVPWNVFATKFIYAPSFDFQPVEEASEYLFSITPQEGEALSFKASSPKASLAPVWDKLSVGDVNLTVDALDAQGNVLKRVGERSFLRDFPFEGPYPGPACDYREAAVKGMLYLHFMPEIQHWKESELPDMAYPHNTYPCKIISATVRNECLVSQILPELKDEALAIARGAAAFLVAQCRPEDAPLAWFPPTYYLDKQASKYEWNQGKTMMLEAASAGQAFLDLYDVTAEKEWLDRAVAIGRTYMRLQRPDGSIPIKVDFLTGEPVNDVSAMLHPLLRYYKRLEGYGFGEFMPARLNGEQWMDHVAVKTFNMTGQFEDVNVKDLKLYQNLTNCTAAPYATYLLTKGGTTQEELQTAVDLIRLSEDQFVHWAYPEKLDYGFYKRYAPSVHEQYKYEMPVDNSACNVANALIDYYHATGDLLSLAKAKALIDNITRMQNPLNGCLPTTWEWRDARRDRNRTFWVNCSLSSIQMLLRADGLQEDFAKLQ